MFTKQGQKESSEGLSQVVGICAPKILSAEWDNEGNTVEVNGEVPLLAGAKVRCLYGGEIEIIDSGQPEAGDMSQVEITPHSVPELYVVFYIETLLLIVGKQDGILFNKVVYIIRGE